MKFSRLPTDSQTIWQDTNRRRLHTSNNTNNQPILIMILLYIPLGAIFAYLATRQEVVMWWQTLLKTVGIVGYMIILGLVAWELHKL